MINSIGTADRHGLRTLADGLRSVGSVVPCQQAGQGGRWLSENRAVRRSAAHECAGCPLVQECQAAAVAAGATFGVWGGTDFTEDDEHTVEHQAQLTGWALLTQARLAWSRSEVA